MACLPNPYKLYFRWHLNSYHFAIFLLNTSIRGRLSNLVDLSFEYVSVSNKRKPTILFPSPLTFLQWPKRIPYGSVNIVWQIRIKINLPKLDNSSSLRTSTPLNTKFEGSPLTLLLDIDLKSLCSSFCNDLQVPEVYQHQGCHRRLEGLW